MARPTLYRWYQIAAISVTLWVVVCAMVLAGTGHRIELIFFSALVTLALFIRVGDDGAALGVEAAGALAVIPLFHDAAPALVAVFLGGVVYHAYSALTRRWVHNKPL